MTRTQGGFEVGFGPRLEQRVGIGVGFRSHIKQGGWVWVGFRSCFKLAHVAPSSTHSQSIQWITKHAQRAYSCIHNSPTSNLTHYPVTYPTCDELVRAVA